MGKSIPLRTVASHKRNDLTFRRSLDSFRAGCSLVNCSQACIKDSALSFASKHLLGGEQAVKFNNFGDSPSARKTIFRLRSSQSVFVFYQWCKRLKARWADAELPSENQYAPSPSNTALGVCAKILMSSHNDQPRAYRRSRRTISSNPTLLRPLTCHSPVSPGLISRTRRRCHTSYSSYS